MEPAVKAGYANRELARRNFRANTNWEKLRKSIDKQRQELQNELDGNKSKLLKQRERLQTTTINLSTSLLPPTGSQSTDGEMAAIHKKRFSFADVYDALMMSGTTHKKQESFDLKSVKCEPEVYTSVTKSTQSSEKKKVRKPMGFSLGQLQRANSNLNSKLKALENEHSTFGSEEFQDLTEEEPQVEPGPFELNEEDKSLGPLNLPPMILPPIRNQSSFKPKVHSFEKDSKEYKQRLNNVSTINDIRYCRYLRTGAKRTLGRRHSAPVNSRQHVSRWQTPQAQLRNRNWTVERLKCENNLQKTR